MKKPAAQFPIDAVVQRRLDALERLIDQEYSGSPSVFEERTGVRMAQVSQWFTGYRALRDKALRRLEEKTHKPLGFFDGTVQRELPNVPAIPPPQAPTDEAPGWMDGVPPEFRQTLMDLMVLGPTQRHDFMQKVHEAAEHIREAFHAHGPRVAAARRGGGRSVATVSLQEQDRRRGLPLQTVPDPFNAQPGERESALYRSIARSPKEPKGAASAPARNVPAKGKKAP